MLRVLIGFYMGHMIERLLKMAKILHDPIYTMYTIIPRVLVYVWLSK